MRTAFLGLGRMGEPMATNLARAGVGLTVWNRSPAASERLEALGACVAASARDALRAEPIAILMLANAEVIDAVLERGSEAFVGNVAGRIIVHMGTTAPEYSQGLEVDIQAAGGRYVECPVSGSRRPAEEAALVAMIAGDADTAEQVEALVKPMCAATFQCGPVPNALVTKLAVNVFLITMVTGLAEAASFARKQGVDPNLFRTILDAGPMASAVSRVKLDKLVAGDFSPQASIADVLMNSRLITAAAREADIAAPLMQVCESLLERTCALGFERIDMIGVVEAF
ncbi:MAG: NAD(P)-dependent oxidoreductase [Sphingobium sp.]